MPYNLSIVTSACIIGIRGWSGTGKTTIIEKALPELNKAGLSAGVIKHAHHDLVFDARAKDTDRLYRAGAVTVAAGDEKQTFVRIAEESPDLARTLLRLSSGVDLVFIEGFKDAWIPEIRLVRKGGNRVLARKGPVSYAVDIDKPDCLDVFLKIVHEELTVHHQSRVIRGGILIGGSSSRMGRPKALLKFHGRSLISRAYSSLAGPVSDPVLIGTGEVPNSMLKAKRLPDAIGAEGPLSGLLAAFRWAPECSWIISAVDMPLMRKEAWQWLLEQRRPGVWAVLPKVRKGAPAETLGACYEPMIFDEFEYLLKKGRLRLQEIAYHPKVITPIIPKHLADAWSNINTSSEWHLLCSSRKSCR